MTTQPIFILSSGRSGTYSFYNALKNEKNIEIHHEFCFEKSLRNSVLYYLGVINKREAFKILKKNHNFSINKSKKKIWIDSSNALPWMLDLVVEKFPTAKFIFLIRNGKKVVSSFFYKHNKIMYDKKNVIMLKKFIDKKINYISTEKKYWRPIPLNKNKFSSFVNKGQFHMICCYWRDLNKKIRKSLKKVKSNKKFLLKFENIKDKNQLRKLLQFVGVRKNRVSKVIDKFNEPINVKIPKNFKLTSKQEKIFKKVCKKEMIINGYKLGDDYKVNY